MELEGLKRCLSDVAHNERTVVTLVTDRHRQIGAEVRRNYPHIRHELDVWHIAKGDLVTFTFCTLFIYNSL